MSKFFDKRISRRVVNIATLALPLSFTRLAYSKDSVETLRLSNWLPPTHQITTEVMDQWAKDVERVTDGEVSVRVSNTAVGAPSAYYDLIRDGVVDVGYMTHDFQANRFRLVNVAELPMIGESGTASSVALWRTQQKYFYDRDEHENVKLLGLMVTGPGYLYFTKKGINSINDIRGLKIRASGGIMTEAAKAVGGSIVSAPPTKSYEVMSNGVVDGTLFPAESMLSFNLLPLVKQVLKIPGGFYKPSFAIMMNLSKWNKLSEHNRLAIDSISGEYLSRKAGEAWDRADARAEEKIAELGIETVEAEGAFFEELKAALDPITQSWIVDAGKRGLDGDAVLQFFKTTADQIRSDVKSTN